MTAFPRAPKTPVENAERAALRLVGRDASSASTAAEWIALDEAAQRLGVSPAHFRRLCAEKFAPLSLARQQRTGGGRKQWHIHISADPRLDPRRGESAPAPVDLLRAAPRAEREKAATKAEAVRRFLRWRDGVADVRRDYPAFRIALNAELGVGPTLGTMYGWLKCVPLGGAGEPDLRAAAAGLLDRRIVRDSGGGGGPDDQAGTAVPDEAWAMFLALYLEPTRPSLAHCWRVVGAAAKQRGWFWPTRRRIAQLLGERVSEQEIVMRREGRTVWERKFAAPIEQDPDAWAANECWEADHSRLDFFARVLHRGEWIAQRLWLTAWYDRRSRRLCGWHIGARPDTRAVQLALLAALREGAPGAKYGPPAVAWLDNGKDFASAAIGGMTKRERRSGGRKDRGDIDADRSRWRGLLGMLDIEARFAQPYNHNGKARIERFFGVVHAEFCRGFASWCGSHPGDPSWSEFIRDKDSLGEATADVMSLPTNDDVRGKFEPFAEWWNHRADHTIDDLADRETGALLSPVEFTERFQPVRRVLADPRALALLEERFGRPQQVGKRGVALRLHGRTFRFGDVEPALDRLKGTERRVFVSFDPADLSSVRVWDDQMRFVCEAAANERHGGAHSSEALRRAMAIRRENARAMRTLAESHATMSLTDRELAAREQRAMDVEETRARLREQGVADAPNVRLVRTPLDGQTPRVESERLRRAAGADSMAEEIDLSTMRVDRPVEDDELDLTMTGGFGGGFGGGSGGSGGDDDFDALEDMLP